MTNLVDVEDGARAACRELAVDEATADRVALAVRNRARLALEGMADGWSEVAIARHEAKRAESDAKLANERSDRLAGKIDVLRAQLDEARDRIVALEREAGIRSEVA
jgi:hypothetical protein